MPGLVPGIHVLMVANLEGKDVGGRAKPGHEDTFWLCGTALGQPHSVPRTALRESGNDERRDLRVSSRIPDNAKAGTHLAAARAAEK